MTVHKLKPRGIIGAAPSLTAAPVRSIDSIRSRLTLAARSAGETREEVYLAGFREGRRTASREPQLQPRPPLDVLTIGTAFFLGGVTAVGLVFAFGLYSLQGFLWLVGKVVP